MVTISKASEEELKALSTRRAILLDFIEAAQSELTSGVSAPDSDSDEYSRLLSYIGKGVGDLKRFDEFCEQFFPEQDITFF